MIAIITVRVQLPDHIKTEEQAAELIENVEYSFITEDHQSKLSSHLDTEIIDTEYK